MKNVRDFTDMRISSDYSDAERIFRNITSTSARSLLGEDDAPTMNQVAAVLRAMADHTLNTRMVSDTMLEHATDVTGDDTHKRAMALGRYFQFLADDLFDKANENI